jgi:hypothetical protein
MVSFFHHERSQICASLRYTYPVVHLFFFFSRENFLLFFFFKKGKEEKNAESLLAQVEAHARSSPVGERSKTSKTPRKSEE